MNPPDWSSLLPTLLAFERSPGRYRVVLREPRPLFEHIGSVMLLAAGRPVKGLPAAPACGPELRRAARFFVRTVMLRPGSDPLNLLGLKPGFASAQLREHYRLMIRLTHPDFASAGEGWPADAATRVNMAKDLLSAPQRRADHAAAPRTRAIGAPTARAGAPLRPRPLLPGPMLARFPQRTGGWSLRARLALAGMGAVLIAGACLLIGSMGHPDGSLAVRRALPVQDPAALPSAEQGTPRSRAQRSEGLP